MECQEEHPPPGVTARWIVEFLYSSTDFHRFKLCDMHASSRIAEGMLDTHVLSITANQLTPDFEAWITEGVPSAG